MSDPEFTILMPVVRSPELMPFAIESVFKQTRRDFEVFIIGDGAPPETIAAAEGFAARDPRVRVFAFTKGERHGEAHRHNVLGQARGKYICAIGDDDLWFPDHLEEMAALLAEFEFGNLLTVNITPEGDPYIALSNLADSNIRAGMSTHIFNTCGPTNTGYRLETYRRLPVGWSPAPTGIPSDLYMWRKFLALPGSAAGTRFAATSLTFATAHRREWPIERRRAELAEYAQRISTVAGIDALRQRAWSALARRQTARQDYIVSLSHASVIENELAKSAQDEPIAWRRFAARLFRAGLFRAVRRGFRIDRTQSY